MTKREPTQRLLSGTQIKLIIEINLGQKQATFPYIQDKTVNILGFVIIHYNYSQLCSCSGKTDTRQCVHERTQQCSNKTLFTRIGARLPTPRSTMVLEACSNMGFSALHFCPSLCDVNNNIGVNKQNLNKLHATCWFYIFALLCNSLNPFICSEL